MPRWPNPLSRTRIWKANILTLDRIDLADIHDPGRLASALHRQLGQLTGPVPVLDIAKELDIIEVRQEPLDGCEGALLTDAARSYGSILVNNRGGARRARFSIAHELGHFLMERHVLSGGTGFACDRSDMSETRQTNRHQKQEAEANSFAISLLAPPYKLTDALAADPDILEVRKLRNQLDVSLEALLRRYVALHDEPLAAVVSHQGRIRYSARGPHFPWVKEDNGAILSKASLAHLSIDAGQQRVTQMTETLPAAWIDNPDIEMFEQTSVAHDGHALTLLWATLSEKGDDDEEDAPEELGTPGFRERIRRR